MKLSISRPLLAEGLPHPVLNPPLIGVLPEASRATLRVSSTKTALSTERRDQNRASLECDASPTSANRPLGVERRRTTILKDRVTSLARLRQDRWRIAITYVRGLCARVLSATEDWTIALIEMTPPVLGGARAKSIRIHRGPCIATHRWPVSRLLLVNLSRFQLPTKWLVVFCCTKKFLFAFHTNSICCSPWCLYRKSAPYFVDLSIHSPETRKTSFSPYTHRRRKGSLTPPWKSLGYFWKNLLCPPLEKNPSDRPCLYLSFFSLAQSCLHQHEPGPTHL